LFRVAHGSASWLTTSLGLAILLAAIGITPEARAPWLLSVSFIPFFLFLFFWYFFRDPERRICEEGYVCPADGKVVRIDEIDDEDIGPAQRIAIFMSPLDVHVNRFPLTGNVRDVVHRPGKHVPAFNKDSDRNERVTTTMQTDVGTIKVVQIAGAVARRIVPYAAKGDSVKRGERLGLIRLGSRCDLIVPTGTVSWNVKIGDRVRAGLSRIGDIREP
jgi:phosphatidylserine decarboxylase